MKITLEEEKEKSEGQIQRKTYKKTFLFVLIVVEEICAMFFDPLQTSSEIINVTYFRR